MPHPAVGPFGPFADWSASVTYAEGDVVYYQGYLYQAMTAITAGDNPRTATYSATLTDNAGFSGTIGTPATRTMRKWTVWDFPFGIQMARLRGVSPSALYEGGTSAVTYEVKTIYVTRPDRMDLNVYPTVGSYAGYGLPSGMNQEWNEDIAFNFAPSAVPYNFDIINGPEDYVGPTTNESGILFQPDNVTARISLQAGSDNFFMYPAWSQECQGQMVSSYQTFSRDFNYIDADDNLQLLTTPGWQDNWQSNGTDTGSEDPPDYIIGPASPYQTN